MTIGIFKIGQIFQIFFCLLMFEEWLVKIKANFYLYAIFNVYIFKIAAISHISVTILAKFINI